MLFFDGAFVLSKPAAIAAIGHRLVLQVAFAALVTDGAIKGVVDEQELHHPFAGFLDHRRVGEELRRSAFGSRAQVFDVLRAGSDGLGRAAFDLDQTHSAVSGHR